MSRLLTFVENATGLTPEVQYKLYHTVFVIFVVWLITRVILLLVLRNQEDTRTIYSWRKYGTYVAAFLILIIVGRIWFDGLDVFITVIGFISAGLTLVLKEPLMNLVGWAFILWDKPFSIGDRVKLDEIGGDVLDIGLFYFTVMETGQWVKADQSTGAIMLVPNSKIFTENIRNYNGKGFRPIWNEIPVVVTLDSDWERAKEVLETIVEEHALMPDENLEQEIKEAAKKLMIAMAKLSPRVYTSVGEYGVILTLRYLCDPLQRRDTTEAIWEAILRRFATEKRIQLAYPTRMVYSATVDLDQGILQKLH